MFNRIFLTHPRSIGESYAEHAAVALGFARDLLLAGAACAVHALVPALFERTASRSIERLHGRLCMHRMRRAAPDAREALDRAAA